MTDRLVHTGVHLIAVISIWPAVFYTHSAVAAEGEDGWRQLRMGGDRQAQWTFVGGPWQGDDAGAIEPPRNNEDQFLAFNTTKAYLDFEAEFDFRLNYGIAGAGFIFRAQDPCHYYMVHFPTTGQQYRAEHFWAAISKVDESGYVQVLKMDLVLGVPSEIGLWHKARVVVEGNEIRLWVDGRPFPPVQDDAYATPGYVGLEAYIGTGPGASSSFRDLRVRGPQREAMPWNAEIQPVRNFLYPTQDDTFGSVQQLSSIARAPNGDLLMKLAAGPEFHGKQWTAVMTRSKDNGRTWSPIQKMDDTNVGADDLLNGTMFTASDGKLYMFKADYENANLTLSGATSEDGVTWSAFEKLNTLEIPEDQNQAWMYHSPFELTDGTFIWPGVARSPESFGVIDGTYYENQRRHGAMNFVLRSTNRGKTWTGPIDINGRNPSPGQMIYAKDNHPSEASAGQAQDGRIVAFVRPITSPWMWESSSFDGGNTWTPSARGPFPMWACSHVRRTASGVLLIAGRHPGLAVRASWDNGMTWKAYRIDTTFWANGKLFEVEPDLVMYASTAKYSDPHVRVHLIRVSPEGLQPLPPK